MKNTVVLLSAFCCLVFPAISLAQRKETTSKDVRLVKVRPSVYISFIREGERKPLHVGDSGKGVWLRFQNNSKWQVGVCTFAVSREYGDTGINYEVELYKNRLNAHDAPKGYQAMGGCSLVFIQSGESLSFSVPREHLADGLAIKVPFRYEWEIDPDGFVSEQEPKHCVYVYPSALPRSKS